MLDEDLLSSCAPAILLVTNLRISSSALVSSETSNLEWMKVLRDLKLKKLEGGGKESPSELRLINKHLFRTRKTIMTKFWGLRNSGPYPLISS